MQEMPTEEALSLRFKEIERRSTGTAYVPPEASVSAETAASQSLLSSSEILCFGDAMTLVPKHAIIQTPKNLSARLKPSPDARLVTWIEFLPANRSWINTVEVSLEQAEGKVPIAAETNESMTKSGKLVVATFNGNPISVLTTPAPTTAVPIKPISKP
jgi:hypothetical protein